MKIKVLFGGQGQYGPYIKAAFDGQEAFMSLGNGIDLGMLPKNAELDVETVKGKTGKHKITRVNGGSVATAVAAPSVQPPPSDAKPTVSRKERDFDAEAKGKTRCSMYAAALQSQALAQHLFAKECDLEAIKSAVREIAEDGVRYTFGE